VSAQPEVERSSNRAIIRRGRKSKQGYKRERTKGERERERDGQTYIEDAKV
jgi:hypothetical protein